MKKIALTGNMGSGKSSVAKILSQYGYCVWDADVFSREVLEIPSVESQVKSLFGNSVFLETGKLDRHQVRKHIFSDHKLKEKFEQVMHPAIAQMFKEKSEKLFSLAPHAWIFYEASLILEKNKKSEFDACVVIFADSEVRKKRVLENRNLPLEEIQKVMDAQMPDAEKIKQSDYTINNSDGIEFLEKKCLDMLHFLYTKWK